MNGRIKRHEQNARMILPRIGHVRTGFKDSRNYPRSTDYFIPTGKYAGLFTKAYGEKPKTIQVVFLEDEAENVCFERYEYRDSNGKLYSSGDGEDFKVWNGKEYLPLSKKDYPNIMNDIKGRCKSSKGWEVILTLRFILPKIKGIAGYWEFSTKGEASSIPQIRSTFDAILENRGFVKGIIFDLVVEFAVSQKPDVKSRFPVVSLIPNESEDNIKIIKGSAIKIGIQEKN